MPDQFSQSFEHESLEADIKTLAAEIKKTRELPETKKIKEDELLRRAIISLPATAPPKNVPAKTTGGGPLPAYAQNAPAEVKLEIEYLLDMAMHQGIQKAIALAKKSSPFVLDTFHDALVGKLYPEFQRRGILK